MGAIKQMCGGVLLNKCGEGCYYFQDKLTRRSPKRWEINCLYSPKLIFVHSYTLVCTLLHSCLYTPTLLFVHSYTPVFTLLHSCLYTPTLLFVHSYTPVCTLLHSYLYTPIHSCLYTPTLLFVHSYTPVCTFLYTYILDNAVINEALNWIHKVYCQFVSIVMENNHLKIRNCSQNKITENRPTQLQQKQNTWKYPIATKYNA